jgi:hypothetical protein
MAFAILKLSYNRPGDSSLTGGICGSGFFIDSRTAITAHHCLNDDTFRPNAGFLHVLVWVITRRGLVRRIDQGAITLHPEIDTTIISLGDSISNVQVYDRAVGVAAAGQQVSGIGHVGNAMPSVNADWQGSELVIRSASLAGFNRDMDGCVKRPVTFDINANDIKMHGVRGFELSFGSQIGMSGGPVIDSSTGRVLGMLSVGLPPDSTFKTETFAISIDEISSRST